MSLAHDILVRSLMLPVLLTLSALFSGSETALFSLTSIHLCKLEERQGMSARVLRSLLRDREGLLSTVLIGNEIVNVASSATAASIAMELWGDRYIGVAVAVMTLVLVFYGEMFPKSLAIRYPVQWSLAVSIPLKGFYLLIMPFRVFLAMLASLVSSKGEERSIMEKDLKVLVDVGAREGGIEKEERQMIHNVFEFTDTTVDEVMTPAAEMVTIDINTPPREAYEKLKGVSYRAVPLYEGSKDRIVGLLYLKDIAGIPFGISEITHLRQVMREPYVVPESKPITDLLKEFQKNKKHMAIVVDEYGGIEGLVTLEDILEEIVGRLADEYEEEDKDDFIELPDGSFRLSPLMDIDELVKRFPHLKNDPSFPCEEVDTVGGLVFHLVGHLPEVGEEIVVGDLRFRVEGVEGTRITRLRMWVLGGASPEERP